MFRSIPRLLFVFASAFALFTANAVAETHIGNVYWTLENVTTGGMQVDRILNTIFILTTVVFILTQGFMIYYMVKYRRKKGVKAHYSHGNNRLEIIWTTLPTIIFLALVAWSDHTWHDLLMKPPPGDAMTVEVVGYQFGWDFLYPGTDGKFADSDVSLISPDNKFGQIDKDDPAGKDDFTSAELVVPVNKPVHILLRSRDVIHSFYVPNFRLYQDAVPGRTISWVWFQVMRPGNFELACSQLCGAGHFNMKAKIRVIPQDEYDKWLAGKTQKTAIQAPASGQNLVQVENK